MTEAATERVVDVDAWLTIADAERVSGKSRRALGRLVEQGVLRRKRIAGQWRYEARKCEELGADDDAQPGDNSIADVLDLMRRIIDSQQEPQRMFVGMIRDQTIADRKRIAELEALATDMVKARERALSEEVERELLAVTTEKAEERKTIAFQQLSGLVSSFVAAKQANPTEVKLLSGLTGEQIEMILASGIATPEQEKLLNTLKEQVAS